jgi:hypothetical protein
MKTNIDDLIDNKYFSAIIINISNLQEKSKNLILEIIKVLNSNNINLLQLKQNIIKGILDVSPSLRSLCWKILFKYIPLNIEIWEQFLDKKREEYELLKKKIYKKKHLKIKNHPLDINTNLDLDIINKDNKLNDIINRDLNRTRTEIPFFNEPSKKNNKETNYDVLHRILFIYAKEHSNIYYIQGLNEIVAIIYYAFSQDKNPYFYNESEADTYYCFENLLKDFNNFYKEDFYNSENGIKKQIDYIKFMVKNLEHDIYYSFKELKIDIYLFVFRWYSLLFSQEFNLNCVMKLWDNIFSQNNKYEYLNILVLCALKLKKNDIISKDLSKIMNSLQTFDDLDVEKMLYLIEKVKMDLREKEFKLNEENFEKFKKSEDYI